MKKGSLAMRGAARLAMLLCALGWGLSIGALPAAAATEAPDAPSAQRADAEAWLEQLQRGADASRQRRPSSATHQHLKLGEAKAAALSEADPQQQEAQRLLGLAAFDLWQDRMRAQGIVGPGPARLAQARASFVAWHGKGRERPEAVSSIYGALPFQRVAYSAPPLMVPSPGITPSDSALNPIPPQPQDLGVSVDAPLHPEIRAKAAELDFEYTRIVDYVRTAIATEWYPGAQRGALGTLRARAGNDVDQASLLIALLRAASVPSRYVHGVIEWPLVDLEQSLGLSGSEAVLRALNRALRAHRPVVQGGQIRAVQMEATWVVAHLPFVAYRGSAAGTQGRTWVALAPAFKPHSARAARGIVGTAGIDTAALVQSYMTGNPGVTPIERLRDLVGLYLSANPGLGNYASQLAEQRPSGGELKLLAGTLPFQVVAVASENAGLLPVHAPQITFEIRDGERVLLNVTRPLSALSQNRVIASFQPASPDDQNLINRLGGGLAEVPPYLIELRPRISVDGTIIAVGEAVPAARNLRIRVVTSVLGQSRVAEQSLVAGGIAAMVLDAGAPRPPEESATLVYGDTEPGVSRVLNNLGVRYLGEWRTADRELARLLGNTVIEAMPALAFVLTQMDVQMTGNVPTRLSLDSVALDAASRQLDVIGRPADESTWMSLAALEGSYREHSIFEAQWAVPAVSADRLLALAHNAGQSIRDLSGNAGIAELPNLGHSAAVKARLQAELAAGHSVRIPTNESVIGAWRGSGWQVRAADGSSGYFISGGLAGGITIIPIEEWFLANLAALLSDPYGPAPNTDPSAAHAVILFDNSQGQIGTVDQELPIPLRARIEDASGRPVSGARVHFEVVLGDGKVNDLARFSTTSNSRGLAEVRFRLGKRSPAGRYLTEGDAATEHPQWMGAHAVRVRADSALAANGIVAGEDYVALARPGPAQRIVWDGPMQFVWPNGETEIRSIAGAGYLTFYARVLDAHDNVIANAPLTAATTFVPEIQGLPPGVSCPASAYANRIDGGVFLPGECPQGQFLLTGNTCVTPSRSWRTQSNRTPFHVVPHNVTAARMKLEIRSPGLASRVIDIAMTGEARASMGINGPICEAIGGDVDLLVVHSLMTWAGDIPATMGEGATYCCQGNVAPGYNLERTDTIESALPGHWLPVARHVRFARSSLGTQSRPDLIEQWEAQLAQPGGDPIVPQLTLTSSTGAEVTAATLEGPAHYSYNLRMPQSPGRVEVRGRFDSAAGTYRYEIDFPPVWSVRPSIGAVLPEPIPTGAVGEVNEDLVVRRRMQPDDFLTGRTALSFLRDNEVIGMAEGPGVRGDTDDVVARGWRYDRNAQYALKFAINEGTPYRIESEPYPLRFDSDVLVGSAFYSGMPGALTDGQAREWILQRRSAVLTRNVNVSSGDLCTSEGEFLLWLAQPARVSAELYRVDEFGNVSSVSAGRLIDAVRHNPGVVRTALPTALPIGRFEVRIRATTDDGEVEEERTTLTHRFERRDHLALGHTMVGDVDLYDGQLSIGREDLSLPGRGPALRFVRSYASARGNELSVLGRGWQGELDSVLIEGGCTITVVGAEGAGTEFVASGSDPQGNPLFRALHGYHGTMIRNAAGDFDVYAKNGTRYHYPWGNAEVDPRTGRMTRRLAYVEDTNGNRVSREYVQLGQRWLVSRMAIGSRQLRFEYELRPTGADNGEPAQYPLLVRVSGPGGMDLRLRYDDRAHLIEAKRQDGPYQERYEYQDFGWALAADESLHRLGSRLIAVRDAIRNDRVTQRLSYGRYWVLAVSGNQSWLIPELRVETHRDALNQPITYSYTGTRGSAEALSTRVSNRRQQITTYAMNRWGGVEEVVDPIGTTTTVWNLERRLPARKTDREGVVIEYTYDDFGNLTRERHSGRGAPVEQRYTWRSALGAPWIRTLAASHTDFAGVGELYEYDSRGNRTARTRDGRRESFSYDAQGDLVRHTDFANASTLYDHNADGQLASEAYPGGGQRLLDYDARGRLLREQDALGRMTAYEYDGLGRLLSTRLADASTRSVAYLDAADARIETDELGRTTRYEMDAMGRTLRIVDPLGQVREMAYDANGNVLREVDFAGAESTHEYDELDRRRRSVEPLGRTVELSLDRMGNILEERIGSGTEQRVLRYRYEHPRYFRTHTTRLLNGADLELIEGLDGEGRALWRQDAMGRRTEFDRDGFGREIERREPLGRVTTQSYDGIGRLTSVQLRIGTMAAQSQTYTWHPRGWELSRTDRAGGEWTSTYDLVGQKLSETDPTGRTTTWAYDLRGRRTEESLPGGRTSTFAYDAVGNLLTESRPSRAPVTHTYDALNRRTRSEDSLGVTEQLGYDPMGRVLWRRDGEGHETRFEVDARGRVIAEQRPLQRSIATQYNVHDQPTRITDARGNATEHRYDSVGRKTAVVDAAGTMAYEYDAVDNLIAVVDRLGRRTQHEYDALNRRVSTRDPAPLTTQQSWRYDGFDRVIAETDRNGIETTLTVDGEGRVRERRRAGRVELWSFDAAGRELSATDALGRVTASSHDSAGRLATRTRPLGAVQRYTYGPGDELLSETDADGIATQHRYDLRLRRIATRNALSEEERYEYDGRGLKTATIRPASNLHRWQYDYDAAGRLVRIIDPLGHETDYAYDRNDNLISETDALDRSTAYRYDALNRLIETTHPDNSQETQALDAEGNRLAWVREGGQRIEQDFDALNRLLRTRYVPVAADGLVQVERRYDGHGNLLQVIEQRGTPQTWTARYDAFHRRIEWTDVNGQRITQAFDAKGNRTERTGPEGSTRYSYNELDQLVSLTPPEGAPIALTPSLAGRLQRLTHPGEVRSEVSRDGAGRVTGIAHRLGAGLLLLLGYTLDANGHRVAEVWERSGERVETSYQLDLAGRLQAITVGGRRVQYSLDAKGNRIREESPGEILEHRYDVRDRLTSTLRNGEPHSTSTFDAAGRQTRSSQGGIDTHYVYNAEDRLLEVSRSGQPTLRYEIDAFGQRRQREAAGAIERYHWDGTRLASISNAVGNRLADYQHVGGWVVSGREGSGSTASSQALADGVDGASGASATGGRAMGGSAAGGSAAGGSAEGGSAEGGSAEGGKRSGLGPHDGLSGTVEGGDASRHSDRKSGTTNALTSTTRHSILTDVHGTPQMLLTASGAIAGHTRSDVWGSEQSQSGTQTRIGHTGYLKDPILVDQLHAQARQYTPTLGRFTTRDPWTGDRNNPITLNKYLAFNGNPGSLVDPTGEYAEAGHYYTVLLASIEAGYDVNDALRLALYAQLPDEVGRYDAINVMTALPFKSDPAFGPIEVQEGLHVLHGGDSLIGTAMTRQLVLSAPTLEQAGIALHALGDSFAHRQIDNESRNYFPGLGHYGDNTRPDQIVNRPELYGEYVKTLVRTLAERRGKPISEDHAQAFADSLVALTDEPSRTLEEKVRPLAQDYFDKQQRAIDVLAELDPEHPAIHEMNKARVRLMRQSDIHLTDAEGEFSKAIREVATERVASMVAEKKNGAVAFILSPEVNALSHFGGTIGKDQEHLSRFFRMSTLNFQPPVSVEKSIYSKDANAEVLESHVQGFVERRNLCWETNRC